MSALDLDALERRARKGIVLNPDETLALITRLRAAEGARDDWRCEVEALQAERDTARVEAGKLRARLRAERVMMADDIRCPEEDRRLLAAAFADMASEKIAN